MRQFLYVMKFEGKGALAEGRDDLWLTQSVARSCNITTKVEDVAVDAQVEAISGGEARFDSEVVLAQGATSFGPGQPFREYGTITFGEGGNALKFDTIGTGRFDPAAEEGVMQGGIVWSVEGGTGLFEGASGVITSNFHFTADGAVTDYHCGVIYLRD